MAGSVVKGMCALDSTGSPVQENMLLHHRGTLYCCLLHEGCTFLFYMGICAIDWVLRQAMEHHNHTLLHETPPPTCLALGLRALPDPLWACLYSRWRTGSPQIAQGKLHSGPGRWRGARPRTVCWYCCGAALWLPSATRSAAAASLWLLNVCDEGQNNEQEGQMFQCKPGCSRPGVCLM